MEQSEDSRPFGLCETISLGLTVLAMLIAAVLAPDERLPTVPVVHLGLSDDSRLVLAWSTPLRGCEGESCIFEIAFKEVGDGDMMFRIVEFEPSHMLTFELPTSSPHQQHVVKIRHALERGKNGEITWSPFTAETTVSKPKIRRKRCALDKGVVVEPSRFWMKFGQVLTFYKFLLTNGAFIMILSYVTAFLHPFLWLIAAVGGLWTNLDLVLSVAALTSVVILVAAAGHLIFWKVRKFLDGYLFTSGFALILTIFLRISSFDERESVAIPLIVLSISAMCVIVIGNYLV